MAKQNGLKKSKLKWLVWTGLIILLLVVGFGPLAMLISFTWNEEMSLASVWDIFRGNKSVKEQLTDPVEDDPVLEPFMVQYVYRYCNHSKLFLPGHIPAEYPEPPKALAEIAVALQKSDLTLESLMEELKSPEDWHLADTREGCGRSFFLLTHVGDFCPWCNECFYLGIFEQKIAVYQGFPPHGKLVELTEIQVKDIDRPDLEKGVIFESEEQKRMLLETFSS